MANSPTGCCPSTCQLMTIVSVQAHYWYKRILIIINIHFIVQVLIRLQPCGHSRWVLLLKMPDGKFFSWLLFNSLSKRSYCIFNCMVYDNKVQGIRVLEKNVVTYLLQKKIKTKKKKKTKASKRFGIPLCRQANKTKLRGKGVGTDLFPFHVTFSNYDLLTRVSN